MPNPVLILLRLACLGSLCVAAGALAQPPESRRVVVIYDERTDLPGLATIDASLTATLAGSPQPLEIYREEMDLSRLGSATYLPTLRNYLRSKYANRKIDVVIAAMGPSLDFMLRHGGDAFPAAPIVFLGMDDRELRGRALPPHVTGVLLKRAFAPTLELALKLHPDAKRVAFVAGSSEFDTRLLDEARDQLRAYEGRLEFDYLTGLPLDELLGRLSELPPDSLVLYSTYFRDGVGQAFIPHEVAERVSAAANAPVYGFLDQYVGRGIVGGRMYSLNAHGEAAARLALHVLSGAAPSSLAMVGAGSNETLFDWRQLQRWGIAESRLPPEAVVRFRPPSAWDQYRWLIVLIALVLLGQTALIAYILGQNRRRHAVEASLAASERERDLQRQEVAHLMRRSVVNQLSGAIAHEISQPLGAIMLNAEAALDLLDRDPPDLEVVRESLKSIVESNAHASEVVGRVRGLIRKSGGNVGRVDVERLFRVAHALLRHEFVSRGIALMVEPPAGVPVVTGDFVQLQQVLVNFLMNAMEAWGMAATMGKEVVLRAEAASDGVRLMVVDNGPGIPRDAHGRVLEPFFTTKPNGLGLGLAICESIAKAHGGGIRVESNPRGGVTATLILPLSAAWRNA